MNFKQRRLSKAARIKFNRIKGHLAKDDSIIDIGMGNGALTNMLRHAHYKVTGLDIDNKSQFSDLKPIVYDGNLMPFDNKSYNISLLITVLHHTPDPNSILLEAKRVSNRIIIIEDIYTNKLQEWLTKVMDSLVNWEFKKHPHTNRNNKSWLRTFKDLGLMVDYSCEQRFLFLFRQVTYVLSTET